MSQIAVPAFGVFLNWQHGREALRGVGTADGVEEVSQRLLELLRLHCSVINGCGFCIAMHRDKAAEFGASEEEIEAIIAGRTDRFSKVEAVALELASAMTSLEDHGRIERAVNLAMEFFDPRQLTIISFQIAAINAWNRLAITDKLEAEHYKAR